MIVDETIDWLVENMALNRAAVVVLAGDRCERGYMTSVFYCFELSCHSLFFHNECFSFFIIRALLLYIEMRFMFSFFGPALVVLVPGST